MALWRLKTDSIVIKTKNDNISSIQSTYSNYKIFIIAYVSFSSI